MQKHVIPILVISLPAIAHDAILAIKTWCTALPYLCLSCRDHLYSLHTLCADSGCGSWCAVIRRRICFVGSSPHTEGSEGSESEVRSSTSDYYSDVLNLAVEKKMPTTSATAANCYAPLPTSPSTAATGHSPTINHPSPPHAGPLRPPPFPLPFLFYYTTALLTRFPTALSTTLFTSAPLALPLPLVRPFSSSEGFLSGHSPPPLPSSTPPPRTSAPSLPSPAPT